MKNMHRTQHRKYSCLVCGAGVQKYQSCGTVAVKEKKDYAGLHGWRCEGECGGPCKVKCELVKERE